MDGTTIAAITALVIVIDHLLLDAVIFENATLALLGLRTRLLLWFGVRGARWGPPPPPGQTRSPPSYDSALRLKDVSPSRSRAAS
jgi:hypothetical protein